MSEASEHPTRRAVVVGGGEISRVHLRALAGMGVEVAAVVDHDAERAQRAAAPLGAAAHTDLDAALTDGGVGPVDVVHVCTPHDQHLPVVLAALARGTHVLVEKPLAHTLADAERVVAAAEAGSRKVGVVLQNRYNATTRAMKEVLAGGSLGPVLGASATVVWSRTADYYAGKRWAGQRPRSGGGVLINQAIHTVDLVQWLLGPVTSVSGRAFRLLPIDGVDVEDTAAIAMTHAGAHGAEVRSTFFATAANAVNEPVTIDVTCERGSLSLRGDLTVTDAQGGETVVSDSPAVAGAPAYWGRSHEALIGDFYARLDEPEPFWIGPREALEAQRILSEVYARS
ncbi:MAG TPA: Gfo/Idh/MocA family oxidoreductase [Actinotalea caeni]|uniref:Gfo/Idh/MocA family protein n=1 Tax=Actinotalea caeni TaxID=1348467 RepID=UPI002B4AC3BA|nr:Gfo/Idh/MocA family oxidoreductase [Actinotalea caeni]HLV57037.1 Gfo/Idh/MocA family oxidoreductase [Actinotalea caeni]